MRRNYVPWRAAGTTTELKRSADEVVRDTGWVFNNRTGRDLSLAEFVETGNHETLAYLTAFGNWAAAGYPNSGSLNSAVLNAQADMAQATARLIKHL